MREAITAALIEQEALALQMREELDEAIRQAWGDIVGVMLSAPSGERERIMGGIVMAIVADIIAEHGEALENESEEQAVALVIMLSGMAGNA